MDFPTSFAIAAGVITAGSVSLRLFGNNKKSISPKNCSDYRASIKEDLDKGETAFQKIQEDLKKQGLMLARIDERTQIWAQKNGFEKDDPA
ncbi:hypothetical protein KAR91_05105 [Candidatus Pacearchaeota archaeon]|nr:hypothetical protein [Candidatus Pacearchaeota archaeon]